MQAKARDRTVDLYRKVVDGKGEGPGGWKGSGPRGGKLGQQALQGVLEDRELTRLKVEVQRGDGDAVVPQCPYIGILALVPMRWAVSSDPVVLAAAVVPFFHRLRVAFARQAKGPS